MELPKEFKGTVYFHWNSEFEFFIVNDREMDDPDYILLGTLEVETQFDTTHDEAVNQMVSNLKNQKQAIQAETQRQLNQIDEKINNLLAITYQEK